MNTLLKFSLAAAVTAVTLVGCADPYGPGPYPGPYPDRPPVGSHPGQVVSVLGCPRQGVEAGCLALVGANGMTWDISAAQPRPDPYGEYVVELTGRVSDRMSICQQGPVLEDIEWRYTPVRCPS